MRGDDIGALERQKKNRNQFQGRVLLYDLMIGFRAYDSIFISIFELINTIFESSKGDYFELIYLTIFIG